jgi:hypothetical protein
MVSGINAPARENKFPRHERVARMSSAEQNFGFGVRPINDDKRGGIPRLDIRVETDTLTFDQMTRDRGHSAITRAASCGP